MYTPDGVEDAFGFGSVRAKDKIKQIKPSTPHEPPADFTRVDEIAGMAGFVSREASQLAAAPSRGGRSQAPEPTIALNMRAPVDVGTAFQRWCKENRYSYPEGLAEIMRRAGLRTG